MGSSHTVQTTLSDWILPTGKAMRLGTFVQAVGTIAQAHGDTLGQWARMVNNLYEYMSPPLILDQWDELAETHYEAASEGAANLAGRYMIPGQVFATNQTTNANQEGLRMVAWARTEDGTNNGNIKLTTPDDNDTVSFADTSFGARTLSEVNVRTRDGTTGDVEVTVNVWNDAGSDWTELQALMIDWFRGESTLPDGPWENDAFPLRIQEYDVIDESVTPWKLYTLIRTLRDLRRRRRPGMILHKFYPNGISTKIGQITHSHTLAFPQSPAHRRIRVYFYGSQTLSTDRVYVNVNGLDHDIPIDTGSDAWYSVDVDLRRLAESRFAEIKIKSDGEVNGDAISAWFLPAENIDDVEDF